MRRKSYGKVLACILLAASMMSSLSACGDKKEPVKQEEQNQPTAADNEGDTSSDGEDSQDAGGQQSAE